MASLRLAGDRGNPKQERRQIMPKRNLIDARIAAPVEEALRRIKKRNSGVNVMLKFVKRRGVQKRIRRRR